MNLLCVDIASGGITAALLNSSLDVTKLSELPWDLKTDDRGAATLSVEAIVDAVKRVTVGLNLTASESIDVICIGSFLHNCVLLDEANQPLTPLFTWLDHRGDAGLRHVRSRLGDRFHQITGCRYHAMFPVFKLASMRLDDPELLRQAKRVVSIKALLINRLCDAWVEDHGMASASGLFNVSRSVWDPEVLDILDLAQTQLPAISSRTQIVGRVTSRASAEFGLSTNIPIIAGTGDGFFANVGSDCETPPRIAVTLGTSAAVRQTLTGPSLDIHAGTFCYRVVEDAYILGCAGSNGGNVLDWGRRIFNGLQNAAASTDPPIFIPLLHGERSPEWNPNLTGSWAGLTAQHTAADLSRSILEGVIFNLAYFVEIIVRTTGKKATDLVLSGNGFLHPLTAPLLASVVNTPVWMPSKPGMASLRGAGICGLRALGSSAPKLNFQLVQPLPDAQKIVGRYGEYRRLRTAVEQNRKG